MTDLARHYAVLDLGNGASLEEVKSAHRRLVKMWHPDCFPHDPLLQSQGLRRVQEINAAYDLLKAAAPALAPARSHRGKWDNLYSVGIINIDKQHKTFFRMFDKFNEKYASSAIVMTDDEVKMDIYLYILNLRRYALNHFSLEEKYMLDYRYDSLTEHRRSHNEFIKKIFELEKDYYSSGKMNPKKINDFVLSWLDRHIKEKDKDLGGYLKEALDLSFI